MRRVPVTRGKRRAREAGPAVPAAQAECNCPHLDPADWHEVESDWSDIAFLRGSVNALLGVPVGFAAAWARLEKRANALGASIPEDPMFLLGSGRFRRPVLLEVEGPRPGARGVIFPGGIAFSRLVSAPWGEMKRVVDDTNDAARAKYGRNPDDLWIWYVTCRLCSRERNFETLVIAHYRTPP